MSVSEVMRRKGLMVAPQEPTARDRIAGAAGGVGGFIGGLVPGPLSIPAAAAGGALGETVGQLIDREPGFSTGEVGKASLREGAFATAGLGLGMGASAVGKLAMKRALRPTEAMIENFPRLVPEAIKRGIVVSQKGVGKAWESARTASAALHKTLVDAGRAGTRFSTQDLTQNNPYVDELLEELRVAGKPDEMRKVMKLQRMFESQHNPDLLPTQLKRIKLVLQRRSRPVMRAIEKGLTPARANVSARFDHAVARYAREQLESIAPEVAAQEAETQGALTTARAAQRGLHSPTHGSAPHTMAYDVYRGRPGVLAAGLPLSPELLSRTALALNNPILQLLLQQVPRGGAAATQF